MSSDLWAEFGDDDGPAGSNPWSADEPHQKTTSTTKQPQVVQALIQDDPWAAFDTPQKNQSLQPTTVPADDEWSAFESAEPSTFLNDELSWQAFDSGQGEKQASTKRIVASNGYATESENEGGLLWDADAALHIHSSVPASSGGMQGTGSLIDISELTLSNPPDEDDEFGEFEKAENTTANSISSKVRTPARPSVASTIMQNRIETQGATSANKLVFGAVQKGVASPPTRNATSSRESSVKPARASGSKSRSQGSNKGHVQAKAKAKPVFGSTSVNDDIDDEAWDDFTSLPASSSNTLPPQPATILENKPAASSLNTNASSLPPSNIPPPSILISLLHSTVISSLITPSSWLNPNPSLRTAAHIVAGRKFRWKRDTHLAQSMSISASGPGLKSGMKLTGVDKSESVREDREAAELARVFKQNAGALRTRAVKAGEKGIVELGSGSFVVRTEKVTASGQGAGGVTGGLKPCVICGLRRAERVNGVDVQVYDGFGEWWIDHWGHRECKHWWEEYEAKLEKR